METHKKQKAVSRVTSWIDLNRDQLLAAGVHTMVAFYSGEGDSGSLDSYLEITNAEGEIISLELPDDLYPLLELLHEDLALQGYENDEGGGGEFRLEIEKGTITHESYYYVTERSYNAAEEF